MMPTLAYPSIIQCPNCGNTYACDGRHACPRCGSTCHNSYTGD